MTKKDFDEIIFQRLKPIIPNKDYYSVLLSDSELRVLLKCLNFCYEMSFFCNDAKRLSKLFDYLESYLNHHGSKSL